MWITYDPAKRNQTLAKRGLDFADAATVLQDKHVAIPDTRKSYGEPRFICYGLLHDRMVVVCYTPRSTGCHVFSMRKANGRERKRFAPLLRK
ncbi:BrnT family toxin [Duganella sp. PWIR1]